VGKHLLDALLDLLLAGDTRGVDVVDTRADVTGVSLVIEDLQELSIRLAVLNGENIGIQSGDGVEEVLELGVAEVRVDLSAIRDASGGQLEGLDGPLEVGVTLATRAKRKTLTQSRLIDLDHGDTSRLEIDDLVAQGESQLLSLVALVNIVTGERPPQTGDRTSEHTLHRLLADGNSVLGLLDGHRGGATNVTVDDGRTNTARAVRLHPGLLGKGVTSQALTEVLDHVVTLGLAVDEDVKVELLLDIDDHLDLTLDELVVLLSSDLTLGELVALLSDFAGLGERANGGGGELGELDGLGLLLNAGLEGRLAVVHLRSDSSLASLDGGVVGTLGGSARLDRLGVGLELGSNSSTALGDSLGNDNDLGDLLDSEAEPISDLGVELLLGSQSVGDVKKGAGGGYNHTVFAELLSGGLNLGDGSLVVRLPDVTAIDDTSRENLVGAKGSNNGVELLRVADEVDVDRVEVVEGRENVNVVDDVTEVGGQSQAGSLSAEAAQLLVGRLESGLDLGSKIENEDGLVDLDILSTSSLQLGQKVNVEGQEVIQLVDGVDALATVGLTESQEGNRTQENGAGDNAGLLGLVELSNGLGVGSQLEDLVVLQSGLHVVVVRVEPLNHLQGGDIDTLLLETTAHGEVLIERVEVVLAVALGDDTEELNVVQNLVVVGKVIARNLSHTGILLDLPVLQTETLALGEELLTGGLATPVSFRGLLQVTELTHTGKTQNGSGQVSKLSKGAEGQRGAEIAKHTIEPF